MKVLDDKYHLKDSVIVNVEEEEAHFISISFKDEQNQNLNGEIYGFVKDDKGREIKGANIHLMNEEYISLMETFTDNYGGYIFTDVKPNINYRVYAIAPNKKLENPVILSINKLERYELNFILELEVNKTFLGIKGTVKDKKSKKPIKKAVIYAFALDNENNKQLKSIQNTNQEGEFYFWQIPTDNYFIKITAEGYKSKDIIQFINGNNNEIEIFVELDEYIEVLKGTIYGIIKNSNQNPIPNADVILYETKNDSLIPIAFTKTDEDGVYLFENIEDGNYKIKASKLVEENI